MKSLMIKNYKNFNSLTLEHLADINLIVGKNNVGKSTLLEAISIMASGGDLEWIKKILEGRGDGVRFSSDVENAVEKEINRFVSLYSNKDREAFFDTPIEISTSFSGTRYTFAMQLVEYRMKMIVDKNGIETSQFSMPEHGSRFDNKGDSQIGLQISSEEEYADETGDFSNGSSENLVYLFGSARSRKLMDYATPFEYVRTNQLISSNNAAFFDRIALSPNEKYIVEALRIIEPRIDAINFLKDDKTMDSGVNSDDRVAFVVLKSSTQRYKLSTMGDGMNRILTIILALLNCENGILLIDEFENGLHYSVQSKLWKIIFYLSKALKIQVFATTHSEDAIRCFTETANDGRGKIIRLENNEGVIRSVEYQDSDELEYIATNNIEIR